MGEKVRHEIRELIPVTVFFFVTFQLLALTESLILRQAGGGASPWFAATVAALVVAKVVLIADHFGVMNRFPDRPLAYNIAWKASIYFIAWLGVRYLEHLVHFWRSSSGLAEANRRLFQEFAWPHFVGVQLWVLILLVAYCAFRELAQTLGGTRLTAMFFTDRRGQGIAPTPAVERGPTTTG